MTNQLLQRPRKLALIISLLMPLLVGCTTSQAVEPPPYRGAATQASFSEAQLDALLAPIALYPDTLLSHLLIASTYPLEVVEADRWARNNTRYKGEEAVDAVEGKDWDPSVKALVAFPDVLKRMSDDLDWTQQLGDAFLTDEERVMDSIQKLRNRAYDSGTLDKVEHVRVIREERTIVIEPSVERVIYVPAYDTRVVYGSWWWPDYPPVYWSYPSSYVFVSGFYWGPRVYLGPRFYFSGVHWHQRRVVVVDHHHHHRFYDSRSVVRYNNARHWHHNPVHRRGVAYYDNRTRERFNSPRESYRDSREYRANLRGDTRPRNGSPLAPNQARDQRQGRDTQFQQQLERRQAGPMGGNDARERIYGDNKGGKDRAQMLRERMNNRNGDQHTNRPRQGDNPPAIRTNNPTGRDISDRNTSGRDTTGRDGQAPRPTQTWEQRREQRPESHTEQPANSTRSPVNLAPQADYRVQPGQNTNQNTNQERQRTYRTEAPQTERPQRTERPQAPRPQSIERSQPRFQGAERPAPRIDRGNMGGGDSRASMRGERQR